MYLFYFLVISLSSKKLNYFKSNAELKPSWYLILNTTLPQKIVFLNFRIQSKIHSKTEAFGKKWCLSQRLLIQPIFSPFQTILRTKFVFIKNFFIGPIIALPFQSISQAFVKFAQGSEVEFMQPIQKARNLALYVLTKSYQLKPAAEVWSEFWSRL